MQISKGQGKYLGLLYLIGGLGRRFLGIPKIGCGGNEEVEGKVSISGRKKSIE